MGTSKQTNHDGLHTIRKATLSIFKKPYLEAFLYINNDDICYGIGNINT